jgi:hypothetical protein
MNATLITKMADSVVEAVRLYVDQRESVLLKRIDELEKREPIPGPAGKDAPAVDLEAVTAITFEKVKALIPEPIHGKDGKDGVNGKDGVDGINGKDGDPGAQGQAGKDAAFDLDAVVAEVVKAVPAPKDGINGKDGKDAEPIDTDAVIKAVLGQVPAPINGINGKDAEPIDTDAIIKSVVAQIPTPKDGAPGRDAPPVDEKLIVKAVLEQVPPPIPGRDGMPGADGANGMHGKDGINGKDGSDAFDLDDFSVEQLKDGRTVRLKWERGERVVVKDIRFDVPLYRRTYMREAPYEKDDMVTYHNEVWIAVTDKPTEPPGSLSKQWQLAIRKGRDSKPVKI